MIEQRFALRNFNDQMRMKNWAERHPAEAAWLVEHQGDPLARDCIYRIARYGRLFDDKLERLRSAAGIAVG